jgi:hypothetical protein
MTAIIKLNQKISKFPNWNNDVYSYELEFHKKFNLFTVNEYRNNKFINSYERKNRKEARNLILKFLNSGQTGINI